MESEMSIGVRGSISSTEMSIGARDLIASTGMSIGVRCSNAPPAEGRPQMLDLSIVPSTSLDCSLAFSASSTSSLPSSSSSISSPSFGLNSTCFLSSASSSRSHDLGSNTASKRKTRDSESVIPLKKRKGNIGICHDGGVDDDDDSSNERNYDSFKDDEGRSQVVFITEPRQKCTAVKDVERFASLDGITKNKRESNLENEGDMITATKLGGNINPFGDDGAKDSDSSAASKNILGAAETVTVADGVSPASKDILDFDLGVFEDVCEVVAQMVVRVEGEEVGGNVDDYMDNNNYDNNNNDDDDDDDDTDESASLEEAERLRQTISSLKEECARLREEKRRIQEEEEERRRERDRLAAEIQRAKEEFARLKAECDRLKRNLAKQEEEIARLRLFLMIARERRRKATMVEE